MCWRRCAPCSAGTGVSAGLGIAASKAIVGTVVVLGSTIIAPITVAVVVTYISKKLWNGLFFKEKTELAVK